MIGTAFSSSADAGQVGDANRPSHRRGVGPAQVGPVLGVGSRWGGLPGWWVQQWHPVGDRHRPLGIVDHEMVGAAEQDQVVRGGDATVRPVDDMAGVGPLWRDRATGNGSITRAPAAQMPVLKSPQASPDETNPVDDVPGSGGRVGNGPQPGHTSFDGSSSAPTTNESSRRTRPCTPLANATTEPWRRRPERTTRSPPRPTSRPTAPEHGCSAQQGQLPAASRFHAPSTNNAGYGEVRAWAWHSRLEIHGTGADGDHDRVDVRRA